MCYNGIVKSLQRCRTLRLAPLLFIGGGENVAGKPKYQSPEEMQEQIDEEIGIKIIYRNADESIITEKEI